MNTELEILKLIYLKEGIHVREMSRQLKIGIPSVKYALEKLISKKLILNKKEARNLKFYLNFKNNLLTSSLYQVEYNRISKLPKLVQDSLFDLIKILDKKPVLAIIFGSYAKNLYSDESDLDLLFVFNETDDEVEKKSEIIGNRYNLNIQPIYLNFNEFNKNFFNEKDKFMKQVKENKIIMVGIELWVMMENEKA
jgi:predicted nucleotidyltransferase